jgi:hypothetical protein
MFEMAFACNNHSHLVILAEVDAVLVMDGASRMDNTRDTCLMGDFDTIGEGEEGIAGHDSPIKVETERLSLCNSLAQSIYT